jgi:catechol 2,3-dioxygenase
MREPEPKLSAGDAPRDPEQLEASATEATGQLSASTSLGPVYLTVSALERSIEYYTGTVGLDVLEQRKGSASVGVPGRELLALVEEPGATSSYGHTGLYHFALLVPERADLARWLATAAREDIRLVGLSDHFVSEAIYLADPDGHGIEIYWDRPRETWEGQVSARMTTMPLDVDSLLGELADWSAEPSAGLPAGTVMGHVHLRVAAIPETVAFYRDVLGLALMAQLGTQAAFLAAGGYHHHIGANTWESAGAGPPPAGTAALRRATIVLADGGELDHVRRRLEQHGHSSQTTNAGLTVHDPSGNALFLIPEGPD